MDRILKRFFIAYTVDYGQPVATVDAESYDQALNFLIQHYQSLSSPTDKAFRGFREPELLKVIDIPASIVRIHFGPEYGPDISED